MNLAGTDIIYDPPKNVVISTKHEVVEAMAIAFVLALFAYAIYRIVMHHLSKRNAKNLKDTRSVLITVLTCITVILSAISPLTYITTKDRNPTLDTASIERYYDIHDMRYASRHSTAMNKLTPHDIETDYSLITVTFRTSDNTRKQGTLQFSGDTVTLFENRYEYKPTPRP